MKRTPNGWDERDHAFWRVLMQLPSYGIIGGDKGDIMISRREVIALMEVKAERRFKDARNGMTNQAMNVDKPPGGREGRKP